MKVKNLIDNKLFKEVSLKCPEREITGVYIGDLLSWVMGRAKSGDAWITIMSNLNILAVASLVDTSCIILAEDVMVEEDVLKAAKEKEINIISTSMTAFQTAIYLESLI